MSFWTTNVTHNPMRFESTRAFRRFFALGAKTTSTKVGVSISVAAYLVLFMVYIPFAMTFPAESVLVVASLLLPLVAVFGFYSCIAGEREKRTWDVIRVSPVRESQIVSAKFLSGAGTLTIIWALGIPFAIMTAWFAEMPLIYSYQWNSDVVENNWHMVACYFGVLVVSITALGLTILCSAAMKRPLNAFCASIGGLFGWLIGVPILLASTTPLFGQSHSHTRWLTLFTMNPYSAMEDFGFDTKIRPSFQMMPNLTSGAAFALTMVFCVLLTASSLILANKIMHRVDRSEGAKRDA